MRLALEKRPSRNPQLAVQHLRRHRRDPSELCMQKCICVGDATILATCDASAAPSSGSYLQGGYEPDRENARAT